jgi:hypothetical protein
MNSIHHTFNPAITLLSFLSIISLSTCTHEPEGIADLEPVCYTTQIRTILQPRCLECHNDSSGEGFDASNYQTIKNSVVPGDPRGSPLYKVITDINGENMMPPDRPLSQEDRTLIQVWIAQGADSLVCDTVAVK